MSGHHAGLQAQMVMLKQQCDDLLARIDRTTPEQTAATFRNLFNEEAPKYAADASACREVADRMQRVADAMRAKLGEVAA